MAIYNTKTKERINIGEVISERGTFKMDTSMDEVVLWDPTEKEPKTIYLCQSDWHVERGPDLSDENRLQYNKYLEDLRKKRLKRDQERFNKALKKGDDVEVVAGRKVPKGTKGMVFFIKNTAFGTKVGIITSEDEKFYTYLKNLERSNKKPFSEAYDDFNKEYVC